MLNIITAQPDSIQYCWQTRVQIVNFQQFGYDKLLRVLVLFKKDTVIGKHWETLRSDFENVQFFFYEDTGDIYSRFIKPTGYEPLVRPHLLSRHLTQFPEVATSPIFYIDSDVLFIRPIEFEKLLSTNTVKLSDTISYIGAEYFDSKMNQVLPNKLEEYKRLDVLDTISNMFGVTRKSSQDNSKGAGGAQYLFPEGTTSQFWEDVFSGSMQVHGYLKGINKRYFKNENEGFQSYTADMWAVLYCLWQRNITTECPKQLDFAWSTDTIERLGSTSLYHDAGMNCSCHNGFMKSAFRSIEPGFVKAKDFNQKLCTSWYVTQIERAYNGR